MTAVTVDAEPVEELVDAMVDARCSVDLAVAYCRVPPIYAGSTVADFACGSPSEPLLLTVEQLYHHLRRNLDGEPHQRGWVAPWSAEDGGRGPALAGPR